MKSIRDTTAGQSLSAFIVVDKKGQKVANVLLHYSDSGRVTCEVYARPEKNADWTTQRGNAGGAGYDKATAALGGIKIMGVTLRDHSESVKGWKPGKKAPRGANLANWSQQKQMWTACFYTSGLDILKDFGYYVHQAI